VNLFTVTPRAVGVAVRSLSLNLKENIMGKTDLKNRQERELQDEELDAVTP
jgi:hypothetical protein